MESTSYRFVKISVQNHPCSQLSKGNGKSPNVRESGKVLLVKSAILGFGIRDGGLGIQNPRLSWIPRLTWGQEKEFARAFSFMPGAHNPERATSMRSCPGVFTDQFIFKTVLARILIIFQILQTSQQNLQTWELYFFCLLVFLFGILLTSNALIDILFPREKVLPKMCLKINWSARTPWHMPSMKFSTQCWIFFRLLYAIA